LRKKLKLQTSSDRPREADRVKETANIVVQIDGGAIWVGTFGMSGLGEIAKTDAVP
jgi:hypothetical protein